MLAGEAAAKSTLQPGMQRIQVQPQQPPESPSAHTCGNTNPTTTAANLTKTMLKQGFVVTLKPHKGSPITRRRPLDCELYFAMVDAYKARSMVPPGPACVVLTMSVECPSSLNATQTDSYTPQNKHCCGPSRCHHKILSHLKNC